QHRRVGEERDDPERERGGGETIDEPALRHALHPEADERQPLPDDVQAEVPVAEDGEARQHARPSYQASGVRGMGCGVILVGDIGGTKATLALAHPDRPLAVEDRTTVASPDFATAAELIGAYADARPGRIQAACFGLPGPVIGDTVKATNLP